MSDTTDTFHVEAGFGFCTVLCPPEAYDVLTDSAMAVALMERFVADAEFLLPFPSGFPDVWVWEWFAVASRDRVVLHAQVWPPEAAARRRVERAKELGFL